MNFIANDYSVRAPPVTIVPTSAGSTVLDLQPDPSLRTIGRSTASRSNTGAARATDTQQQSSYSPSNGGLADLAANDAGEDASPAPTRPRSAVDLYRSTQANTDGGTQFRRVDLYA